VFLMEVLGWVLIGYCAIWLVWVVSEMWLLFHVGMVVVIVDHFGLSRYQCCSGCIGRLLLCIGSYLSDRLRG
jgi:hypothetical protein